MIQIAHRQILVDGRARLVVAGEVHYFRTPRDQWAQRLDLLVEAGCNAVASYIPWLLHELPDGSFDVDGHSDSQLDVGAFIDLCAERGLWFIARPGPFCMAELKNEGIPYRVYRDHPEIIPVGWDGEQTPTATVDYLAPAFLAETLRWYDAVLPVIATRLQDAGGPVIALQLDNEVGMLAWVTNHPDLTDGLLADFHDWLCRKGLRHRYPTSMTADPASFAQGVRSPRETWAGALRVDLTRFMRGRFAAYIAQLRSMAEADGITGIPFLVNIHGTEGGGAESFGIGISQLMESYSGIEGMVSGSDHYVGDMTLATTTDLYVINAQQAAVHDEHQPLTSLEFECGTGDYGGGLDQLYDPATVELKSRLFWAQGNRMLSYYLLAGGTNGFLPEPVGDGDDRISFTGERHGTAAPITPEGERGLSFASTASAIQFARRNEHWLASSTEQYDALSLGFVPDSYATEYAHPGSAVMREVVDDMRRHRGSGQRRALTRSALLQGYRFDAVDLSHHAPRLVGGADGRPRPVTLMLATATHIDPQVQQRVVEHLGAGSTALLLGPVPTRDLEGRPCTLLADALGIAVGPTVREGHASHPTVVAHSWMAPLAQTRVGWMQELDAPAATPLFTSLYGQVCAVEASVGDGRAVVLAAELPSSLEVFGRSLRRLGCPPGLEVHSSAPGIFATTTIDASGNRFLHLLNVTGFTPELHLVLDGETLGVLPMAPGPRRGWMLPLGVAMPWGRVVWANAEIEEHDEGHLVLGSSIAATGVLVELCLDTPLAPQVAPGVHVERDNDLVRITGPAPLRVDF